MLLRLVPLSLLALSGCAGLSADAPSLLPRAIEQVDFAEPVRTAPVARPDPSLDALIAAQVRAVAAAEQTFDRELARAEPRIRSGGGQPQGSERWIEAQVALATLDVARLDIDGPRGELERMALDRAVRGDAPYPALNDGVAEAARVDAAQRGRIADLTASLR